MRFALPAALLLATLALGACARRTEPPAPTHAEFAMRDYERGWAADSSDTAKNVWVSLHWPEFTRAPGAAAVDSLNAWVRARLLGPSLSDTAPATFDALAEGLIASYRGFREEFPDSRIPGWYHEHAIEVAFDTLGVVSLASTTDAFTGGAHGMSARGLAMFDWTSGRRLSLDDLVRPDARDSLERLIEAAFRRERGLDAGDDLGRAGFWFEGNRFRAGANAGFDRNGLVVFWNSYDVAPYAMGPTEAHVDWEALRPLLRADAPPGSMLGR